MKNKLLLVSCALFLFSGTAFAENLLVTKTSGGADEEGTLPYVVANAPGGSVIELSIGDEDHRYDSRNDFDRQKPDYRR